MRSDFIREPTMPEEERYEIERKFLDRGIFSWHFRLRYRMLRKMGVNAYSLFAFLLGVAVTLGVLQLL